MQPATQRSDSLLWVLLVVVVLAMVIPGVFLMGSWGGTGMMGGLGGTWGWGLPMLAIGIVFVIVLIALLAHGESAPAPAYPYAPAPVAPPSLTPVEILDARYARGEITRDEYLRMRQDLDQRRT